MKGWGRPVVSASRAFAHVDALLAQHPGLTRRHVCRLAGLSESAMSVARRTMRIEPETEERLLAVTSRHVLLCPPPQMPASIAREHVQSLLDQTGLSRHAVARASGVNYQTIYNVMKPEKRFVMWAVHAAILSTTADDVLGINFWEDRWPSIVRLRALQANSWSLHRLGEQVGMNLSTHANASPDSPIERTAAAQIKTIYEAIGDEPGPSHRSAVYARRLGFMPPIYYDDDMKPVEVEETDRAQVAARLDLCILGLTLENRSVAQIVEALGLGHDRRVSNVRRRAGIRIDRALDGGYEAAEAREGAFAAIREAIKPVHYRTTIDLLDDPDTDYVALLATVTEPERHTVAA